MIRETEVRIALKQAEGSDARPGLQINAHVWAAKVGFEKLPKAVQSLGVVAAYKEHLQEKRAQLVEFRAAVDQQINKANTHIREAAQLERREESLRAEAVNATKLCDATVKRLMEISLERDAVGFQVNVLSAKGIQVLSVAILETTKPPRLPSRVLIKAGDDLLSRYSHYHGPQVLNGRVRNGNGCGHLGMVTGKTHQWLAV